jgi:DNA-binding CsgD family transcriptional regulator
MPTLIVDGLTAKEIADRLDVSVHTMRAIWVNFRHVAGI